jgi:hypothetical protein
MVEKPVVTVCILAVCLATVSCKKLEPTAQSPTGPLTFEPSKFSDAIPDDYGNLVGITQNPAAPKWIGLWFQKPDHTITGVFVNLDEGRLYGKTLTIPRK